MKKAVVIYVLGIGFQVSSENNHWELELRFFKWKAWIGHTSRIEKPVDRGHRPNVTDTFLKQLSNVK
jgi:hypothetical protein